MKQATTTATILLLLLGCAPEPPPPPPPPPPPECQPYDEICVGDRQGECDCEFIDQNTVCMDCDVGVRMHLTYTCELGWRLISDEGCPGDEPRRSE